MPNSMTDIRTRISSGAYNCQTAGLLPGSLQTNIVILPADYAHDFLEYCLRNPKPCRSWRWARFCCARASQIPCLHLADVAARWADALLHRCLRVLRGDLGINRG